MSLSYRKTDDSKRVAWDIDKEKYVYYSKGKSGDTHLKGNFYPVWASKAPMYLPASSGSGKSVIASKIIDDYLKQCKKGEVAIISALASDESIPMRSRRMNRYTILDFVNSLRSGEISKNDLEDTLVIFDDIYDPSFSRDDNKLIDNFLRDLCFTFRHIKGFEMIFTSHFICASHKTEHFIRESHSIFVFPLTNVSGSYDRLLKTKLALRKDILEKIMNIDSRWVQISLRQPKFILTESEIFLYK